MVDQAAPPSLPPVPPLVGREREQATLRDALDAALAGHGSLVLIGGEAGIGKTALAEVLLAEAIAVGATVLVGRCYDLSETPPYGPWAEALAHVPHFDGPPAPPDLGGGAGALDRAGLFAAVREYLAALTARSPLVLLLEDLHWADPASLDLLRTLARQIGALALLLLVTYRADEVMPRRPLYPLLPLLVREARAARLALRPLDLSGVAALVAACYPLAEDDAVRLVAYLDRRAQGNPFFVGEMLHTLEESGLLKLLGPDAASWALGDLAGARLPSLVLQVIDGRAARLGEGARGLLAVAAAIGQEFDPGPWAAVGGVGEEALLLVAEAALEARLLEAAGDGGRLRFAHALVREALYEAVPPVRRPALHRRIAEALSAAPQPDPDAVAYHFQQSGDARAYEWLLRAAARARTRYAPRSAVDHATRALALGQRHGLAPSPAPYRERGLAYEILGEYALAQADQEVALVLARAAGQRRAAWQALLDLGQLWAGRDYARTGDYYRQALDLARAMGEPADLAHTLNAVGNWHVNVDQPFVGQGYQREALVLFRELGDRRGVSATVDQLGMALFLAGDLVGAAAEGRAAAATFRQLGDRQALATTLAWLCECGGWYGGEANAPGLRPAEARQYGEEAVELARAIGSRAGESFALLMLAVSCAQQGEYGYALDLLGRGWELAEEVAHGEWLTEAQLRLGALHRDLFAADAARRHLERALAKARDLHSTCLVRLVSGTLALACVEQGDFARARTLLDPAALGPEEPPYTAGQRHCRLAWLELALAEGDAARALRIADGLVSSDAQAAAGRAIPHVWRARARALAALERRAEALVDALAARDIAAELGARPLLWRLHADIAVLARAAGRPVDAATAAAAARALIHDLAGTVPEGDLREGFLRGALALVPPDTTEPAGAYPAGLTAREVEVLRLVARGLTDAEVAKQLFLSPRTISTHLRSIYGKLDVSSRTAAARLAAEYGLS